MCALDAAHQLSSAERQLLDSHVAKCGSCRAELEDFREAADRLSEEHAAQKAPILDEKTHGAQFAQFAAGQGLNLSEHARRALANDPPRSVYAPVFAYASAAVAVSLVASAILLKTPSSQNPRQPVATAERRPIVAPPASPSLDRERIAELESNLKKAESQASQVPILEEKLRARLEKSTSLQALVEQRDAEIGQLKATVADSQKQIATAQSANASFIAKNEAMTADLMAEHARSASLVDELRDQKAAAERERQLTAATREVRDLMGARRLFMIDVYDGEDRGRANRSFGRVFYTEGQSLIFYAFDLDQNRSSKRVTFAAWGERGKDAGTIKQLGVFQLDDLVQKRWVMKVEDPDKLRSVDAIFVTVENRPTPERPTGQKLLYAYLGGQPNHP
jgi:hypothetical protein